MGRARGTLAVAERTSIWDQWVREGGVGRTGSQQVAEAIQKER